MESSIEAAEELFLLGKFQDVLNMCEAHLERLPKVTEHQLSSSTSSASDSERDHYEDSIAPISLMIQSLFELHRSSEVMSVVLKFYREMDLVPTQILLIWYEGFESCFLNFRNVITDRTLTLSPQHSTSGFTAKL